jgi:hypothetical protein
VHPGGIPKLSLLAVSSTTDQIPPFRCVRSDKDGNFLTVTDGTPETIGLLKPIFWRFDAAKGATAAGKPTDGGIVSREVFGVNRSETAEQRIPQIVPPTAHNVPAVHRLLVTQHSPVCSVAYNLIARIVRLRDRRVSVDGLA